MCIICIKMCIGKVNFVFIIVCESKSFPIIHFRRFQTIPRMLLFFFILAESLFCGCIHLCGIYNVFVDDQFFFPECIQICMFELNARSGHDAGARV